MTFRREGEETALKSKVFVAAAVAAGAIAAAGAAASSSGGSLTGAGSTWVAPLMSLWQGNYKTSSVNYNPIGSGGGIVAISNRQVDFGASDAPLTPAQFGSCRGCVQIPWTLGATSVPYHLNGAPYGLKITGPVLADIYLGKITRWNDKRIQKLNKFKLPATKITPVFRSDGSGTTYNFTDYLSHVSRSFRSRVGTAVTVNFPAGIGAKGSSGVSAALSRTDGAITYVDFAYSKKSHFKFFKIQNRAGIFTLPGFTATKAAAAGVKKIPASNAISIVDPPKKQKLAYPICTFSYVILPKKTSKAADLKKFVTWTLTRGQIVSGARAFLYLPIPKVVQKKGMKTLASVHT